MQTIITHGLKLAYAPDAIYAASIRGSATPNELLHRAKWPKHPNNKGFDKSGVCSKSSKVADPMIKAFFVTRNLDLVNPPAPLNTWAN
jgi:hypothetical protein